MPDTDIKTVAEQFVDRVLRARELEAIEEYCSPQLVCHLPEGAMMGPAGLKRVLAAGLLAFPDVRVSLDLCIREGCHVACRLTVRATFTGRFGEVMPNGRKMSLTQLWLFHFEGLTIAEIEVAYDTRRVREQLGAWLPNHLKH
ncbi:MAG TPA: ester cyclase [bacterium]|jgi:predicted ester cyclase